MIVSSVVRPVVHPVVSPVVGVIGGSSAIRGWLGFPNCQSGAPVWSGSGLPAFWTTGDIVSGDLNDSITFNGDKAGTVFAIHSSTVSPTNGFPLIDQTGSPMVLETDGTFGITTPATISTQQGGTYAMVFSATNQYGTSLSSDTFELIVGNQIFPPSTLDF